MKHKIESDFHAICTEIICRVKPPMSGRNWNLTTCFRWVITKEALMLRKWSFVFVCLLINRNIGFNCR